VLTDLRQPYDARDRPRCRRIHLTFKQNYGTTLVTGLFISAACRSA
jgi:hypothetical protein